MKYEKFCSKEVNRLKEEVKELNKQLVLKENEFQNRANEVNFLRRFDKFYSNFICLLDSFVPKNI